MQCTARYATAYIQEGNLKIKPSKRKDPIKKKKMQSMVEDGVYCSSINVKN